LSLPNVFLRDLMRRMTIKDRSRLRLTCRAFEKLVTETHAGYFDKGSIFTYYETRAVDGGFQNNITSEMVVVYFGDAQFKIDSQSAMEFTRMRNRLFSGISFAKFEIRLTADSVPLEFTRNLIDNFKIGAIQLFVESELQFTNALLLMADFASSKHIVIFK
ncbi:hypothetical protein PENTCL1PPCAC_13593, partial [Pristionchus entomophagus]